MRSFLSFTDVTVIRDQLINLMLAARDTVRHFRSRPLEIH